LLAFRPLSAHVDMTSAVKYGDAGTGGAVSSLCTASDFVDTGWLVTGGMGSLEEYPDNAPLAIVDGEPSTAPGLGGRATQCHPAAGSRGRARPRTGV